MTGLQQVSTGEASDELVAADCVNHLEEVLRLHREPGRNVAGTFLKMVP